MVGKFPINKLKQKSAKKVKKLIIQESFKVESTPKHHCRENNASGTSRLHSLPSSRPPAITLKRKDTTIEFQTHYALCDILEKTDNKLK